MFLNSMCGVGGDCKPVLRTPHVLYDVEGCFFPFAKCNKKLF